MIAGDSSSESRVVGTYSLSTELQYNQRDSAIVDLSGVSDIVDSSLNNHGISWDVSLADIGQITYSIDGVDTTIAYDVISDYLSADNTSSYYFDSKASLSSDYIYATLAEKTLLNDGTLSNQLLTAVTNEYVGYYTYENWTTDKNEWIAYNPYNEYTTVMVGTSTTVWDTNYAFLPGEYTDGAIADYRTATFWNDEVSSIQIYGDISVTLYNNDNYTSLMGTVTSDVADFTKEIFHPEPFLMPWLVFSWNDQLSSITIDGDIGDGYVVLYQDINYQGNVRYLAPFSTSGESGFRSTSYLHEGLYEPSPSFRTIDSLDDIFTVQIADGTITEGSAADQTLRLSFYNSTNGWSDYYKGSIGTSGIGYDTIDQMKIEGYIGTTTEKVYQDFNDYMYDWTSSTKEISQTFNTLTFSNQIENIKYDIASAVKATYAVKEVEIDYESKESTVELPDVNESGVVEVDLSILGGDAPVILGGGDVGAPISIGGGAMSLSNTVVIKNDGAGGEVSISADMSLSDGASFVVFGSGHTTSLSSDVTVSDQGEFKLDDSLKIGTDVTITTEDGAITIGNIDDDVFTISGDDIEGDDTLVLKSETNINIYTSIGIHQDDTSGTDEGLLDGLTVTSGSDVLFQRDIKVDGDVTITADNAVFNGDLYVMGDLIISADYIDIAGDIFVEGDIIITAKEFDFANALNGMGTLTLLTKNSSQNIEIAVTNEDLNAFNISSDELANIGNSFTEVIIGHSENGHAKADIGDVTIGTADFVNDTTIFANSILVANSYDIEVDGETTTIDYTDIVSASASLTLDTVASIIIENDITSTSDISLYTATAGVNATGTITATSITANTTTGANIKANSASIDVNNTTSSDVVLTLSGDSVLSIDTVDDIIITSTADVTLSSISATSMSITSKELVSNTNLDLDTFSIDATDITLLDVTVANDFDIVSSGDVAMGEVSATNMSISTSGDISATNISATSLDIDANDVNINTDVDTLSIDANDINITEANSMTISSLSSSASVVLNATSITLSSDISATNDMTINSAIVMNSDTTMSANSISITATDNITLANIESNSSVDITTTGDVLGSDINITATDLTIEANSVATLNTNIDTIDLTTTTGNVTINETSTLSVTNLILSGNLDIVLNDGGIDLSDIVTTGTVSITAKDDVKVSKITASSITLNSTGDIIDDNSDETNFVTDSLSVTTNGSFGIAGDSIETEIGTFTASGISSLYINETDSITLNGLDIQNGDMLISATSLSINSAINTTGNVLLESRSDAMTINSDISAKNIALSATELNINSAISSTTGTLSIEATDGAVTMGSSSSISISDDVSITATDTITIDDITSNSLRVVTTGALAQNSDSTLSVDNLIVDISSSLGDSQNALNLDVSNLAIVNASEVNIVSSGDIVLTDVGIVINEISASGLVTTTEYTNSGINSTGDVSISANSIKQVYGTSLVAQNIVLNAQTKLEVQGITANSIDLDAVDTLKIKGDITSSVGDISAISTNGAIVLLGDIDSAGTLEISSNSDINQYTDLTSVSNMSISTNGAYYSEGNIVSSEGEVSLSANGDITLENGMVANSGISIATTTGGMISNGNITTTTGDVSIDVEQDLSVGSVSAENITVVANNIIDTNIDEVNFTATTLDVTMAGSFGISGDSIETDIDTFSASGISSLYLNENDEIVFSGVSISEDGDMFIAASDISIDSDINTTGNIMINVKDSALSLSTDITANNIVLKADSLNIDSTLTATGSVSLSSDTDSIVMTENGAINTQDSINIDSASDIVLADITSNSLRVVANGELTQVANSSFATNDLIVDITGDFGSSENYFNLDVDRFAMGNATNVYITSENDINIDTIDIVTTQISDSGEVSTTKYTQNGIIKELSGVVNIDIDGDLVLNDMLVATSSEISIDANTITVNANIASDTEDVTIVAQELITTEGISIGGKNLSIDTNTVYDINSSLTSSEDMSIVSNGDINILSTGSVSSTGAIDISSSGAITMDSSSSLDTVMDIDLSANDDISLSTLSTISNITLTSTSGGVYDVSEDEESNITASSLSVDVASDFGNSDEDINIDVTDLSINSANMYVESMSDININEVTLTGAMSVVSNGGLIINQDLDIVEDINIETNSDITFSSISSDKSINISSVEGVISSENDVNIDANDITLGADIVSSGNINIDTTDLIAQGLDANSIVINTNTAEFSSDIVGASDVTIVAQELITTEGISIGGKNLSIDTNTVYDINSSLTSSEDMSIVSNGDINILSTGSVSSTGAIDISSSGAITMDSSSSLDTVMDIDLSANDDISLSTLSTISNITLTSTSGGVYDVSEDEESNITASSLSVDVASDFGNSDEDINIDVTDLSINSANMYVESMSDININEVTLTGAMSVVSNGGLIINQDLDIVEDINIETNSDITFSSISSDKSINISSVEGVISSENDVNIDANDITLGADIVSSGNINIDTTDLIAQGLDANSIVINTNTAEFSSDIIGASDVTIDSDTLSASGISGDNISIDSDSIELAGDIVATNKIYITTKEDIAVNKVSANDIVIHTDKAVTDNNGDEINFVANTLEIVTTSFGVMGDSMDTNIEYLDINDVDSLYVNEEDSITLDKDITVNGNMYLKAGDMTIHANIVVNGGTLEISSTNDITMSEDVSIVASEDIIINAIGDIFHHDITSTNGDLLINSSEGSILGANIETTVTSDVLTVRAYGDIGSVENIYTFFSNNPLIVSTAGVAYLDNDVFGMTTDLFADPDSYMDTLNLLVILDDQNLRISQIDETKTYSSLDSAMKENISDSIDDLFANPESVEDNITKFEMIDKVIDLNIATYYDADGNEQTFSDVLKDSVEDKVYDIVQDSSNAKDFINIIRAVDTLAQNGLVTYDNVDGEDIKDNEKVITDTVNYSTFDILENLKDNSSTNSIFEEEEKEEDTKESEDVISEDSIDDELFGSSQLASSLTYESTLTISSNPVNNIDYSLSILPSLDTGVLDNDILSDENSEDDDFEYAYWTEDIAF
jgi:hypothetical protein